VGWIGCVRCEKFRHNFVTRTCALIAPLRPVLHQFSCVDETVQNAPKYGFRIQQGGSGAFVAKVARFGPIFQRFSCSDETVQNATKHEFRVQWGGSSAFNAKSSEATSLHELVHKLHQFSSFCIDFRAVTKRSETH
jgi:hypothetical protein